jgi:NTP pyrophosphatase (non-canonical NTP hydrolase)
MDLGETLRREQNALPSPRQAAEEPAPLTQAQAARAVADGLSPEVLAFAFEMERRLRANAHKGGPEQWRQASGRRLWAFLIDEVLELRSELRGLDRPTVIAAEAADVANFALMIADQSDGLEVEGGRAILAALRGA